MDFTEIVVGSSDEGSVLSQEIQGSVDDNWVRVERRYNDHFHVHEFHLRSESEPTWHPIFFAEDVANIWSAYDIGSITAIRLQADVVDETTGEIRENVRIRLESSLFYHVDDLRELIFELVISNLAPMWIRIDDFETSDMAVGKFVWYNLKFFDLCIQKTSRTSFHTTKIVGDGEVHPGVWTKRIFPKDHNIKYGLKDCTVMCMNEVTGKRFNPRDVKHQIWPEAKYPEKLDFHRKKHLKTLSTIYDTGIIIYSIDDSSKLVIGQQNHIVELVKVGKVVGVLDRFEKTSEPDDTVVHSEGYFDLETVGEVQRVYAYCFKTPYWSCTIVDADLDDVEDSIRNDIGYILERVPEKETLVMYSWNGSRFDSYIMLRILTSKKRFTVDRLIINSANELLTFRVKLGDSHGNIVFRDPCKLFPNTLEGAADILGLEMGKSGGVDHDEVEQSFIEVNKWPCYLEAHKDTIGSYVHQDVHLLEGVVNGIRSLYSHKREYALSLRVCLTRSMASNILWMKMLPKEVRDLVHGLQIDPYTDIGFKGMRYMDIMPHAVGGRVQCVKRGTFDKVGAIDVKSMYPHVCADSYFPCGDSMIVKDYVPGKLGVYYARILKQTKPMVIPYRKNRQDPYDWEYGKPFEKWVTSIDLEQIDEYVVFHGIVWSDKTKSFFKSYMEAMYLERQGADSKALNLHWKIFMNALTGSIFQAALRDFTLIVSIDKFEETMKKYSDIVHVLSVEDLNNKEIIIIFRPVKLPSNSPKIRMQKEFCASAITSKPWILTMFLYAYARRKLRDMWIKIEANGYSKVLYCDTDSLVFSRCDLVNIEGGSNLGDWEKEHWNARACLHASKIYAVGDKVRIKGVSPTSQSLICDTEIDIPAFESFEEASSFFRAGKEAAVKPGYEHVEALVQGKHVYFMSWYMGKSRTKGIVKKYCIKHLKPDVN